MTHVELAVRGSSVDEDVAALDYAETDGLVASRSGNGELATMDLKSFQWQYVKHPAVIVARYLTRLCRRIVSREGPVPGSEDGAAKPKSTRPATAYLDGLRGVAALCVVFTHIEEWTQNDYGQNLQKLRMPFGWKDDYLLACWPMLRVIFTGGGFAVALFFIMSGYVLSYKPNKLILAKEWRALTDCVSSAMFRRWFRLFLPIFAVNFIWVTSWHIGIYESARPAYDHKPLFDKWTDELHRLFNVMTELSSFFGPQDRERFRIYNPPMWTIPDEFRGSMVVYVTTMALAQFTNRFRLISEGIFCIYLIYIGQTPLALFIIGLILCHIDALERTRGPFKLPRAILAVQRYLPIWWHLLLLAGIYLGGLSELTAGSLNNWRQIHATAALLTIIAIPRIPWCKVVLEARFCQFLGRISYALYLTHLPVLWLIGARIYAAFGRLRGDCEFYGAWCNLVPLPAYGPIGMEIDVIIPSIIFVLLSFGVAELGTRFIDDPSVKIAQVLYRKGISN